MSAEDRSAIFRTGTGFAGAKLSEILPAARAARFVRMTQKNARFGTNVELCKSSPATRALHNCSPPLPLSLQGKGEEKRVAQPPG